MTEGIPVRFCTKCGSPLTPGARFCVKCGAPIAELPVGGGQPQSQTPPVPQQAAAPHPTSVAGALRTTASYAGTAAAMGGLAWQTVVSGQRPDMGQFLARAGVPAAQQIVRRSIRKPAVALVITTLLDTFVAWVTGQPSAMAAAGLRLATGLGTGLLGMIVGKRGGFFRALVGIGSLATTALQGYNAISMLLAAIARQAPPLQLLPAVISTASVIFVAVRMAIASFGRVKRS